MRTPPPNYTTMAKLFHWSMATLILVMLALGFYMADLDSTPLKFQLFQWHKSVGILILLLLILRLLWRLTHRPPAYAVTMPLWQKAAAHTVHYGLYFLMFSMPMSGYVMSDAAGYHPNFFGLPVPMLSQHNPETASFLAERHTQMAWILLALIGIHVAAALYHHLRVKDATLRKMLPQAIANRLSQ